MYLELAYSGRYARNAALLVYGAYIEDDSPIGLAIARAGWRKPPFAAPRLPASVTLTDTIQTETYIQPAGSAMFNGQTESEAKRNLKALRSELAPFGYVAQLARPRKMSIQECL